MLLLEGLNLHVAGVRALLGKGGGTLRFRSVETALMAAHIGGYLTAVFWVLSPAQAVCFLIVQQGLFGRGTRRAELPDRTSPSSGRTERSHWRSVC